MPFTKKNLAAMETLMKAAGGALFSQQRVDSYDGPQEQMIKMHVGSRRANETDITGGAVADTQLIATIDADDWDAKIGRPPYKGDVIWWLGSRHAVTRASAAAPADNKVFYKVRLQG